MAFELSSFPLSVSEILVSIGPGLFMSRLPEEMIFSFSLFGFLLLAFSPEAIVGNQEACSLGNVLSVKSASVVSEPSEGISSAGVFDVVACLPEVADVAEVPEDGVAGVAGLAEATGVADVSCEVDVA